MGNYKEKLKNITTLIFDYDGVLSDGTVMILGNGEHIRSGHVKDGYAIHHAMKKNMRIAIISGGYSESMEVRCRSLGIQDTFLGVSDKTKTFNQYLHDHNLSAGEVLYMGDDIPDYPVMKMCGLAVCPSDAAEEIKAISAYISPFNGGKGCVRDIIEQVLKVQDKWMDQDAHIW
jgi:3-deoxy-D-manno-octulosonate 8-phosphate phosphatase (KDO 8-P phosphatase)